MIPRDPLTLQRQLAGLATLEATVRTVLRALYTTYPALARRPSDDDVLELTSARMLADACNDLLLGLDDHRSNVATRLRALQHPDQTSWPF
ncbi:MAG TPA: hypothetical protein VFT22_34200 [Kofleriaceae bacterium]|nr:hypothetical protein [Kofleriaceae bacterium]